MSIFYKISDLPDKMLDCDPTIAKLGSKLIYLFKTSHKPSHTIPIVWLIMCSDGITMATHYKYRLFSQIIPKTSINCIKLYEYGARNNMFEIIFTELNRDNFQIRIPKNIDLKLIEKMTKSNGIEVLI